MLQNSGPQVSSSIALAAALADALSRPGEAHRRGESARAEMRERRSIDAMTRRHEAFYLRALGGGDAGGEVVA